MFNYFINAPDIDTNYPIKTYFKWNVLKKMYIGELAKVVEYYRDRNAAIENSNILVRLLKSLIGDIHSDVLEYMTYSEGDIKYLVKQFHFVSNISDGKTLKNVIFEGQSSEIFLSIEESPDPITMADTWEDYQSIRVIDTDIDDVYYPVPFRYEKPYGTSIFEINIMGMLLQYYYWANQRESIDRDTSPNVFLSNIVFPNITYSLVDYAIWNRFKAIALGNAIEYEPRKHPVYLIDYTKGIDKVLMDVIKNSSNSSIYVTELLKTIPTIVNDNMYETLRLHKSYYNKQSKWVLWVSRIDDIVTIHKTIGKRGYKINRGLYNIIPYDLKLMERGESTYDDKVGPILLSEIYGNIEYLHDKLGKR